MIFIEDCVEDLHKISISGVMNNDGNRIGISAQWDRTFLEDVADKIGGGNSLSTGQSAIVVKLITRYENMLVLYGYDKAELDVLVRNPIHKRTPYQSIEILREVRYCGNKKLVFRSKYNEAIVKETKKLKTNSEYSDNPYFNYDYKLWIVEINDSNVERAMNLIKRYKFSFDEEVEQFFLTYLNTQPTTTVDYNEENNKIEVFAGKNEWLYSYLNDFLTVYDERHR
jgi:hypothetical protein